MRRTIEVFLGDRPAHVSTIHLDSQGARESAAFEYASEWLASPDAFALAETPSRLRDESACEGVCVFEFAARKLSGAFFEGRIELEALVRSQVIVLREQHFDGNAFWELDVLVEHDLPVLDVSS